MRICIICNFGPYSSVGGSEIVIREIAENLIKEYGYTVDIYAHNYGRIFQQNGVNCFPCKKGEAIINKISHNYSHIFVYSDSQWNLNAIIKNIKKINCRVSLALVGAYYLQSHPEIFNLLKKNISKFNLITHSSITSDYKWCIDNNLPVKVIPNGVNLFEFSSENTVNFREKYKIKEKYIILSISNFFYGKNLNALSSIYEKLSKERDDFIFIQISNTVKYPYDKLFFERCQKKCKGMNIKFLRDIPRKDIVSIFKEADVFVFTSLKEVAPLVILEARAARIPFVSLNVGNIKEQKGGIIINSQKYDNKGYVIVDLNIIDHFVFVINYLLDKKDFKRAIQKENEIDISQIDWKIIVPKYDKVFNL